MANELIIEVTDHNFDQAVLQQEKPVLLDVWSKTCHPCKMLAPVLDSFAIEYKDRVTVCKMDVDQAEMTAYRLGISYLPTLILFNKGQKIRWEMGFHTLDELVEMVRDQL